MIAGTFSVEELIDDGVLAPPMDGNHGSIHPKTVDYVQSGIPFIMASDLVDGRVDTQNCAFLSDEQANSLRKGFSKTGDVLLSHKATIGRTAIVGPLETDFIMLTPQITYYRVLDEDRLDRRYLYYYFNSRPFQELLGQWAGAGSTRAYLGITGQRKLPIVIPEPAVQKDIVRRLGALDDKIELNRRMNETLEEMARALFRDWFVDFGPTRRQMECATDPAAIMGQAFPPEKAATLAPLFPAKLGGDGLPEGWQKQPVGELAEIVGGGTPNTKTEEFWEGGAHLWATPRDLSKLSGVFIGNTERKLTDAGLAKISSGLSPTGSVLMSSRAPIGYLAIASQPVAVNQGFIVMRPTDQFPTHFAKLWCEANMETIEANANGSTFQEISKKNFKPILATVPSAEVMAAFADVASLLFDKVQANEKENQILVEMRDLLLPKLMSGEIRLSDGSDSV
ncbi:restriction endonuclease subunit S [Phaeobacter inhibens]|uniref:restriction endonuclease subunit S n=1 Tax=Phaeobacter inhibens TaxID=221822 RepID=UPI0021A54DFF|nr:restriction endonuclease subunit S [Phaeobacter inhibens]UWR84929.1 restriction endonuclease subunit S [Phaeobacter inhibens]